MPVKTSNMGSEAKIPKPSPPRGPKPSLSAGRIAQAAIGLADADGLNALTMQKLAHEVGLTTMALYRYFPSKAHVVSLMIDSVADSPPSLGSPKAPWSARLQRWAHRCLAIYQDHPWFLEATTTRQSPMGPNELAWMEAALALLAEAGLKPKDQHHAFVAIIGHVRGYATFGQAGRGGKGGQEWIAQLGQSLLSESRRFPASVKVFRSGVFSEKTRAAFDFGLDCILRGLSASIRG